MIFLICPFYVLATDKTDFASKKRQLADLKEDTKKEGLDLSIKRRRMEDGKKRNKRNTPSIFITMSLKTFSLE